MPDSAIHVRGLRRSFGPVEAVRGLDLDIAPGEVYALLGPNGAGKTTTIEVLEGFRRATAGHVRVLGADPSTAPPAWRDRIGIVLQESAPDPGLTVRQALVLYAGYHARPRPIDATLALVGLSAEAGRRSTQLSGGQRRRLDLALAVIGDPDLIFLDEPTTGFDPAARRAAWDVVDGLRELGATIVLTTHHMDEAERLADRIGVMVCGRLAAEGPPATLGGRDRAEASLAFTLPDGVGAGELPPELLERAGADGRRLRVASARPLDDLERLAAWTRCQAVELPDLEVRRASLEDVYLRLTSEPERVAA
jgi:ABC-2 type transport system ATP-binding protein